MKSWNSYALVALAATMEVVPEGTTTVAAAEVGARVPPSACAGKMRPRECQIFSVNVDNDYREYCPLGVTPFSGWVWQKREEERSTDYVKRRKVVF